MLESLAAGSASATMLSKDYALPLSNVSYHLCKVLYEECELVKVAERNQRRGAEERVFELTPEGHVAVALVGFLVTATAELEAEGGESKGPAGWRSVAVDRRGREEITELIQRLEESVEAIAHRCANRRTGELHELLVGAVAFGPARHTTRQGD